MADLTGQTFAGCEIVSELGQGGMGAVYKARQALLNRFVALKVMVPKLAEDPAYVARFIREAASAASLSHPNMVQVHTAGEQNGLYYIVMEFVEGHSLRDHIASHGQLDPHEAIAITVYTAQALQYAWNKAKLIHRDIKPGNIFLSSANEVKVGDLGLAKSVGESAADVTSTGITVGSPHYISPEQALAKKDIDFRSDIYSMGCTLYHMLTGRTPYDGDSSMEIVMKHVHDLPPPISEVWPQCPEALGRLVGKMLAKNRNERYQSYEELIADLFAVTETIAQLQSASTAALATPQVSAGEPTQAASQVRTVARTVRAVAPKKKPSAAVYAMAGVVVVVMLAGLMLWSPWNKPSSQDSNTPALISSTPALQHPAASSSGALKQLGNVFTNSVGAEMVYIPPGEFMMGSTKEDQEWMTANRSDVKSTRGVVQQKVTIKQGFWLGRTEVTVGQWKRFVKETGYVTYGEKMGESEVFPDDVAQSVLMKGKSWRDPNFGFEPQDDQPVSCISWNDAMAFCEWLDKRELRAGRLVEGYAVRLPTEAEWEYSCRAGRQTRFWWGDSMEDGKGRLNWRGKEDGYEFVAPVDSYRDRGRNQFGLADMLGNVWEWCLKPYEDIYPGAQVLRGGSFHDFFMHRGCDYRFGVQPGHSRSEYGFRLCYGVDVSGKATTTASTSPTAAPKEGGILAPPETRFTALTANPKVGNVFTNSVGAEMVYIPPGEFMMGSTKEEQAWALANGSNEEAAKREGEAPRKVTIKQGFWMGRTEVTVGQWKQFVKETGYVTDDENKGESSALQGKGMNRRSTKKEGVSWRDPDFGFEMRDSHPVCCVSWNDAVAFCKWMTEQERKAGRLSDECVVRLPTEAEWEYACRARTLTKFWWGESQDDNNNRINSASKGDGFGFVAPVDSYGARGRNGFGLADMLGNVREWCLDEYDATQAHGDLWRGKADGHVLRGGSFNNGLGDLRCASRSGYTTTAGMNVVGFRICYGVDVSGVTTKTASTSPAAAPKEGGILAPPETRVSALTTTPKVGEVFTLNVGSNVTMELMGIPPGEFMLGSTKEEQAWAVANGRKEEEVNREGEAPRKATIKRGFWMGRTEVTVEQWKQFVKETGYVTSGERKGESVVPQGFNKPWGPKKGVSWRNPDFGFEMRDDHPVCCISWDDAMAFCKWLEGREQKAGRLPQGYTVRLPTEAEWEYACRAGTQAKFWWGESEVNRVDRLNGAGNDDGFEFVAPVDCFGGRGRNRFGLADMLGNVWEWCLDEYDVTQAHGDLWTGCPGARVLRGGSFLAPRLCRCAARYGYSPAYSNSTDGFRVCVSVIR